MSSARQCLQCGAPVSGESPQGLCMKCLLGVALAPPEPALSVQAGLSDTARFEGGAHDWIGHYKLLEKIGEGGCGIVYMAEQREPVRRRVALKVIKLGMDSRHVVARFEAERQALALMDHPNIARVLDGGTTEAGRPYFVMELVRGIPITRFCDEKKLDTQQRLELFIQVCQAVQHAHQKGIIHRDIKPSNILVADHDGVPVPKIIDFGIAKATAGETLTDKTLFTAFQQFIGTPAYMSPEQAQFSGLDIDTRSDIYSLGVLLYELLTGQTPFEAKRLMAAGLGEIGRIIREEDPPKPSTRLSSLDQAEQTTLAKARQSDPPKLVRIMRGDLDWIVMKTIEKDRSRRYETANGLAADIKRFLGNEPVVARPPSTGYKFRKFARRNKLPLTAAILIALTLIVATGVSLGQAKRAIQAKKEASAKAAAERAAREESEAILKFMTRVFQSPDPARDGRTITVAETIDRAVTNLNRDLAAQPMRRAQVQSTLGSTYFALGLDQKAIALQEKVRDYYLANFGPDQTNTLSAIHNLATFYFRAGRRDEALKLREQLLQRRRKVLGPEHPDSIAAMNNLAISYAEGGRREEAVTLLEEVLAIRRKGLGPEHQDTLSSVINLGNAYFLAGRREEALKLREDALRLCRETLGPEHPATLQAMKNLGISYAAANRQKEALKLREDNLRLCRKALGPEHPDTIQAIINLGNSYYNVGRADEAIKMQEEGVQLSRKVLGSEHPSTLVMMDHLGVSYSGAGRREEALKLNEELLPLCRKVLGPEGTETVWVMNNLANCYAQTGRRDEAMTLLEQVLAIRRKTLGPEHPDTLEATSNLAEIWHEAGRRGEALKLREEVLPVSRKVLGPEHPDTLERMTDLAVSLGAAGRRAEAVALQEQSLAISRRVLQLNQPYQPLALKAALENLADLYDKSERKAEADGLRQELADLKAKVEQKTPGPK